MFRILVVDDDNNLNNLIAKVLTKNGYQVFQSLNVEKAYDIIDQNYVDLIITDIMMPGTNGYTFTRALRNEKIEIPILIITAKEEFRDKAEGFNAGADDYLVKPINMDELLLRVGALLRRAKISSEKKVTIGKTTLDYDTYTVNENGKITELPQKEFNIFSNVDDSETYASYYIYIVKEEDTIDKILDSYKITKEELMPYNELENIKPGDKIIIPSKNE